MSTLTIHTDGGARGNPGPAAIGVVMACGNWRWEHNRYIGDTTNNVAEYTAVLDALHHLGSKLKECQATAIAFYLDSELVVRQIKGEYRVKEPALLSLYQAVQKALREQSLPCSFTHVRREHNADADRLVNQALDTHLHSHV